MADVTRTYTFAFDPDPSGGFVVTCPALPGLVTHGATLDEARDMARDAMEGYLEVLLEDGDPIPESDQRQTGDRFDRLVQSLQRGGEKPPPLFEPLTARLAEPA